MKHKITPFLMFDGDAKAAMDLYMSVFGESEVKHINYFDDAPEKIQYAIFSIHGQDIMCIDSSVKHDFGFTPATSLYVVCETEEEINDLFHKLSENGKIFMEPDSYGFSRKYTWLEDRFGVSWQLNFE